MNPREVGMPAATERFQLRAGLLWLVSVLVMTSCSGSPSDRSPASSPATSSAVTAGNDNVQDDSATTTSTLLTQPKGVLQRHDAPPEGVAAQATFFFGGDPPDPLCGFVNRATAQPSIVTNLKGGSAEVLTSFEVCLVTFIPSKPASIQIRDPGGTIQRRTIRLSRDEGATHLGFRFEALPDNLLGSYRIQATQGSTQGGNDVPAYCRIRACCSFL
jgi:hypothetical protein